MCGPKLQLKHLSTSKRSSFKIAEISFSNDERADIQIEEAQRKMTCIEIKRALYRRKHTIQINPDFRGKTKEGEELATNLPKGAMLKTENTGPYHLHCTEANY